MCRDKVYAYLRTRLAIRRQPPVLQVTFLVDSDLSLSRLIPVSANQAAHLHFQVTLSSSGCTEVYWLVALFHLICLANVNPTLSRMPLRIFSRSSSIFWCFSLRRSSCSLESSGWEQISKSVEQLKFKCATWVTLVAPFLASKYPLLLLNTNVTYKVKPSTLCTSHGQIKSSSVA